MSHIYQLRTEIRERAHLLAALRDLRSQKYPLLEGIPSEESNTRCEGTPLVVRFKVGCSIHFERDQEVYEMTGDFWAFAHASGTTAEKFLSDLNRQYAYNVIRDQAHEQNLVFEEHILANGDVEILLTERH